MNIRKDILKDESSLFLNSGVNLHEQSFYQLEEGIKMHDLWNSYPYAVKPVWLEILSTSHGNIVHRKTYSLFDMLADVGGLMTLIKLLAGLFISGIANF